MRLLTFKFLFLMLLCTGSVFAQEKNILTQKSKIDSLLYLSMDSIADKNNVIRDANSMSKYDKRVNYYRKHWNSLIPTQGVIQACGNMGLFSLGIGWSYGRRSQWETVLLFGYIPKFSSDDEKYTMTLKQNFIPWSVYMKKGWSFEPLECGLYFNTVFGHDFWTKQPTKYESGYYPFSTRIRPNIFIGERFTKLIPNSRRRRIKSFTLFYELSTNDIYFMRFYRNGNASFWDVFGLSLGLKVQFL